MALGGCPVCFGMPVRMRTVQRPLAGLPHECLRQPNTQYETLLLLASPQLGRQVSWALAACHIPLPAYQCRH